MAHDDGGPAFPQVELIEGQEGHTYVRQLGGMSKLELFAAFALAGQNANLDISSKNIAHVACADAEALLAELRKRKRKR